MAGAAVSPIGKPLPMRRVAYRGGVTKNFYVWVLSGTGALKRTLRVRNHDPAFT